jgi:hypothetical protein
LVSDTSKGLGYRPGWCTYSEDFNDFPEVEFFCGGINTKTTTAAALWRQGNLLHFGFEQPPHEMNEVGRNLLLNSIAYIARFTEDRPIAITPSVFAGKVVPPLRGPERNIKEGDLKYFTNFIAATTAANLRGKSREEHVRWFEEVRDYLHSGPDFKLDVDTEAQAIGARLGKPAFFENTLAALQKSEHRSQAITLLVRYIPEGPGDKATPDAWQTWIKQNQQYLFFSEAGGYRYYLDTLAQKRGISTAQLRGPARASKQSAGDVAEAR